MPPTGERLLSIGEFSRLTQLSIRMLRHYDEHDVLRPTRIDRSSGYRSYSPALLRVAGWVRRLRDLGLGVAEIATCVAVLDQPEALRAVLQRQRTRLVTDATDVLGRIREVDHLITTLEEPIMSIEITLRTLPARTVASVRGTIPTYPDEGLLWQRLMSGLPAAGAIPAQAPRAVAVFHDDAYVETDPDVEVQLDVAAPFESTDAVRCVELPEMTVAVGTLHGPYDAISAVMEAIGRWVPEHGYRFAGPMFDNYLVGPTQDPDPTHWVTDVCLPVAPVAAA